MGVGRSTVYGWEGYKRGHVLAGVTVSDHSQARLLQSVLADAMRDRAGRPEEAQLARMYNELEGVRRRARRDSWIGWESPL